jgi:hypothetical protein
MGSIDNAAGELGDIGELGESEMDWRCSGDSALQNTNIDMKIKVYE